MTAAEVRSTEGHQGSYWGHRNSCNVVFVTSMESLFSGSQNNTSSKPTNITLIPTSHKSQSRDKFKDHQPPIKSPLPSSQEKKFKPSTTDGGSLGKIVKLDLFVVLLPEIFVYYNPPFLIY